MSSSTQWPGRESWLLKAMLVALGLVMASGDLRAGPPIVSQGGILYFVNTTSDAVVIGACENGNPGCSLRGAISAANTHPGADGIQFSLPAGSIINLGAALPNITQSVGITGPGPSALTVRRNAGSGYSIFRINTSEAVTISGITINNASEGSGVETASGFGMVTLTNCVVSDNSANLGGGIRNGAGTFNVSNCTVSGNSSKNGGAILNGGGTLTVTNSTIMGNSAWVLAAPNREKREQMVPAGASAISTPAMI